MQRLEEYEDRKSWLFLNLNPPLISKLDLMWIFSSDLQFIGMLIAEYNLSNDRIRISVNLRVVALYIFFLDHLKSSDLSFGSESYDSNTKMYPVRI